MEVSDPTAATSKPRIGVLLSGGGRTLQNLLDRAALGTLAGVVVCVASNRADAFGLERARRASLPTLVSRDDAEIYAFLESHGAELLCLCGYLRLLSIPPHWRGRVLNIHPALLPRHGGKGYYGDRVHAAVLAARDTESGCTVHYCDDRYDTGAIVVQKRVPVLPGDDVHMLAARVFEAECEAYPEAIARWSRTRGADQR
ncbi:MAG: phosphoribosylglycinamide formyltransferase [Planctomycetes bacterium]|nr:phosphoribosylglycinamide formyltransferase [Planctomycetota bacterium]